MIPDYQARLRERYRFELDTTMVRPLFFALATQTPDSILASLSPTARAPSAASSQLLARVDGDSLTFPDLLREPAPLRATTGGSGSATPRRSGAGHPGALFRRLLVRDAKDRGFADDPVVARELRLIHEGPPSKRWSRVRVRRSGRAGAQAWLKRARRRTAARRRSAASPSSPRERARHAPPVERRRDSRFDPENARIRGAAAGHGADPVSSARRHAFTTVSADSDPLGLAMQVSM